MKRLLTVWNVSPLPHPNTTTSNPCHSFFFHSFLITCVCVCVHIFDVISFLVWKTGEEHVRRKRNGQRRCDGGGGWKRSGWIVSGQRSSTGGRFESGAGRRRRWRIEIAIGIAGAHVGLCPWLLLQPARRCLLATGNAFPGGHERRPIQLLERPAIRRVSHKSIWFTYHGVGERKNTIDINIFWNALRPYGTAAAAATLVVVPLTASFDVECNISPDAIWLKFAFLASSSSSRYFFFFPSTDSLFWVDSFVCQLIGCRLFLPLVKWELVGWLVDVDARERERDPFWVSGHGRQYGGHQFISLATVITRSGSRRRRPLLMAISKTRATVKRV